MINHRIKEVFRWLQKVTFDNRNTRFLIIVVFIILIPINGFGQKTCKNPPVVSLSESSGSTCYMNPVTISGNTFWNATVVTITTNGAGTVGPGSTSISPFEFTYTPAAGDANATVIITVTTDNPLGVPCATAFATYTLTVNATLGAPIVGTITQPTCLLATGGVELSGLPAGSWTINPGAIAGTGTTASLSNLAEG